MIPSAARRRGIYVRRRFAVALCFTAVCALAWTAAARADTPRIAGPTVVVQPGDTVWTLGQQYAASGTDLRRWTAEVEQINHLDGAGLTAGQSLRLPA